MGSLNIIELLRSDGSIIANKSLAISLGLLECVFLSELISKYEYFKANNLLDEEGFFYNTQYQLYADTGIAETGQQTARNKLKKMGLIDFRRKGLPAKIWYKITSDDEKIIELLKNGKEKREKMRDGDNLEFCSRLKKRQPKEPSNPINDPVTVECVNLIGGDIKKVTNSTKEPSNPINDPVTVECVNLIDINTVTRYGDHRVNNTNINNTNNNTNLSIYPDPNQTNILHVENEKIQKEYDKIKNENKKIKKQLQRLQDEINKSKKNKIEEEYIEEFTIDDLKKLYDYEAITKPYSDQYIEIVHEILNSNPTEPYTINKSKISSNRVKIRLLKLNHTHFEHVINKIKKYKGPIENTRGFIITCLYNSITTIDTDCHNQYMSDQE